MSCRRAAGLSPGGVSARRHRVPWGAPAGPGTRCFSRRLHTGARDAHAHESRGSNAVLHNQGARWAGSPMEAPPPSPQLRLRGRSAAREPPSLRTEPARGDPGSEARLGPRGASTAEPVGQHLAVLGSRSLHESPRDPTQDFRTGVLSPAGRGGLLPWWCPPAAVPLGKDLGATCPREV